MSPRVPATLALAVVLGFGCADDGTSGSGTVTDPTGTAAGPTSGPTSGATAGPTSGPTAGPAPSTDARYDEDDLAAALLTGDEVEAAVGLRVTEQEPGSPGRITGCEPLAEFFEVRTAGATVVAEGEWGSEDSSFSEAVGVYAGEDPVELLRAAGSRCETAERAGSPFDVEPVVDQGDAVVARLVGNLGGTPVVAVLSAVVVGDAVLTTELRGVSGDSEAFTDVSDALLRAAVDKASRELEG